MITLENDKYHRQLDEYLCLHKSMRRTFYEWIVFFIQNGMKEKKEKIVDHQLQ